MCECRTRARRPRSGTADGDEVQRLVEVARAQREVAPGDRRHEAVVEALGDAQLRVDVVPAGVTDRELVQAQHARVEESEQLDAGVMALEQVAELLRAVL